MPPVVPVFVSHSEAATIEFEKVYLSPATRAEVKREAYAGNVDQNAGVETASGSERVSTSDEGDPC